MGKNKDIINEDLLIKPKVISPYAYPGMIEGLIVHRIKFANSDGVCRDVTNQVSDLYGFTPEQLKEKNRRAKRVEARQICMYILKSKKLLTVDIGRFFDLDHTTVIHSVNAVNNRIETDPEYRALLYKIIDRVNAFSNKN